MGIFKLLFAGVVYVVLFAAASFIAMPVINLIVDIVFAVMPIVIVLIVVVIVIALFASLFKW